MTFMPGDILACYGRDSVSLGISAVTSTLFAPRGLRWSPSHVGIVCEYQSRELLIESTTLVNQKCAILDKCVSGLQSHCPTSRVQDYVTAGGSVAVLRLTRGNLLTQDESRRLSEICESWIREEVPYDMVGAALSGTRVYQSLRIFPAADISALFCSEFLAYVMQSLCRMNRSNPSRYNPGRLVRELVKTGVYSVNRRHEPGAVRYCQ